LSRYVFQTHAYFYEVSVRNATYFISYLFVTRHRFVGVACDKSKSFEIWNQFNAA